MVNPEGKPEIRSNLKARASMPVPDWKPVNAEMVAQTDKMLRADTSEQTAALGLLRAVAHLAQMAYERPNKMQSNLKQVRRALSRLEMTLYEGDF